MHLKKTKLNSSLISNQENHGRETNLRDIPLWQTNCRHNGDFPSVAIGHLKLLVSNIASATDFFAKLGLHYIERLENTAILELRGGTHLILVEATKYLLASGCNMPFDLMVDDIVATRRHCIRLGLSPSEIQQKQDHRYFIIDGPDGYLITMISSHMVGKE